MIHQIETPRLRLRHFEESDLDDYYEYGSSRNVGPRAGWPSYPNKESAWRRLQLEINKPFLFAIELKEEEKVIGSIEIMDVKKERYKGIRIEDNSRELGSIISEKYWGCGYMPEAVTAVLGLCFNELQLSVVYAGYLERNIQSVRLKEKCGFKTIGRVQCYRKWVDGTMSDLIAVCVTKDDFEKIISQR